MGWSLWFWVCCGDTAWNIWWWARWLSSPFLPWDFLFLWISSESELEDIFCLVFFDFFLFECFPLWRMSFIFCFTRNFSIWLFRWVSSFTTFFHPVSLSEFTTGKKSLAGDDFLVRNFLRCYWDVNFLIILTTRVRPFASRTK